VLVEELIQKLNLLRHPEGGWYRESYRSDGIIPHNVLPEGFTGPRPHCTAIYFLLEHGDISALHRIKSDELWHFYAGASLTVHVITPQGEYYTLKLGSDIPTGETFQSVVPAGCWFGAELSADLNGVGYAFVGCTVAPGFDFADFEMGEREELLKQFPNHGAIIQRLAKNTP
jgi:predicted cupin superfamily sugar epimerase